MFVFVSGLILIFWVGPGWLVGLVGISSCLFLFYFSNIGFSSYFEVSVSVYFYGVLFDTTFIELGTLYVSIYLYRSLLHWLVRYLVSCLGVYVGGRARKGRDGTRAMLGWMG